MITDSILHDCLPTESTGATRLFTAGSMRFVMSELVGLSGVRVASPHQKDAVMLLPSLRQIDPADREEEGMDVGPQWRKCPQTA